jgi:hypothetical protein
MGAVQLNILDGIREKEAGLLQAVTHADSVHGDWSGKAWQMFVNWLSGWAPGHKFLIEDFRFSAELQGLEKPPSSRAYGFISVRARKQGLIIQAGTAKVKNVKAHRANAGFWMKV